MGHEVTLPEDTRDPAFIEGTLLRLSDQVARRAVDALEVREVLVDLVVDGQGRIVDYSAPHGQTSLPLAHRLSPPRKAHSACV